MASAILSAPEVADAKRAIDLLLRRHEPFPAIVTDRRWNVVQANRAATRLMTMLLGPERMQRPLNHMRMFLAPDELRPVRRELAEGEGGAVGPARGTRRWQRRLTWRCNRPGANF